MIPELPQVCYGPTDEDSYMMFYRICPKCTRFVKADEKAAYNPYADEQQHNATCKKCGRVVMPFGGFWGAEELGIEEQPRPSEKGENNG